MITLFEPPRAFETVKTYGRDPRAGQFSGLGDIWDTISNWSPARVLPALAEGAGGLVDTLTGAKASREAQQRALELAKAQYAAQSAATESRTAAFAAVAPWVGLAVVGVGLVIAVAVFKK